jgi:Mrp family chromosome partitioning ATPase
MTGGVTVALVLAAGAAWEPAALQRLEGRRDLAVLRRCVDADELLAAAAAGQAEVALVGADAPGLDARVVAQLRRHGVRVVAVVPAGPAGDQARARGLRAGITLLVDEGSLGELPEVLLAPEPARAPVAVEMPVEMPGEGPVRPAAGDPGTVLAVWGPAGAPGRSTLAAAYAGELARRGRVTLLVDADPYGGAIAQQIGVLDEVSGLLAAARLAGAGELAARLPGVVRMIDDHLGVVTGLPRGDRWQEVRGEALTELLMLAAGSGDVVVDTGFDLDETDRNRLTQAALEGADAVLAVGAADPVGLARLARGLADLRERTEVPLHVVVNRMRPTLGWTEQEVAQLLGRVARPASLSFLPDDRATVDRALVGGRMLLEVAPDGALPRAVAALVDTVADRGTGSDS